MGGRVEGWVGRTEILFNNVRKLLNMGLNMLSPYAAVKRIARF